MKLQICGNYFGGEMFKRILSALLALWLLLAMLPAFSLAEDTAAFKLPAGVLTIGEEAFINVPAEYIVLPDGLVTISARAFAGCEKLAFIEIPDSVTQIAPDAFEDCENLCILCNPGSTAAFCAELAGIPWKNINGEPENEIQEIILDAKNLKLNVGDSAVLKAQVLPEDIEAPELLWFSSDESIATVANGKIKAVAPGQAVISVVAAQGGAEAGCTVQVAGESGAITFSGSNIGASSTNAYFYVKAAAAKSGSFSSMGLRMWDPDGKLAVDYDKSISTASKTSTSVWFDVFSDSGVMLQPETKYTCQAYVVYNNQKCWTDFASVTTDAQSGIHADAQKDEIVSNLQNCKDTSVISSSKKLAMVTMADALLGEGYHPAFVAGVLSNIYHEGTFGKFESSKYSNGGAPAYLVYMDENHDYRNKYSGKLVYNDISLSELSDLLDELSAGGWKGKFGLGSVQWTGGRTKNLVKLYLEEAAGSDTITKDQVITAEVKMIKSELAGAYKSIYSKWQSTYAETLSGDDAAFGAAYRVCVSYEVPATYRSKAIDRGGKAVDIYKIMMQ